MKNVTRLVTEDPINKDAKGEPKWVLNDYLSDTIITVNNIQKPASEAIVDDTISQGKVIKVVTFEYNDDENPQVLAA
jgi:hypothetical protein